MPDDKSLLEKLKLVPKGIFFVGSGVAIGFATSHFGFPPIFVKMWLIFWTVAFAFSLLLDLPSIKKPSISGGTIGFFATFVLASSLAIFAGHSHPQYQPKFEVEKLNKPPIKELPTGPEAIAAGKELFNENKCFNCHKANHEGSSDRGPNFDNIQIGVYASDWIKEQIVDPRKQQHPGFDDEKSKKAMPDYFGEDIEGVEMDLLLVFLKSLQDNTKMPVRGRMGAYTRWMDDPEMVAYGKTVFEGEANPAINCSVCHGKDATPLMTGAAEFKTANNWQSKKHGKPMSEMTDADWYKSVYEGVPGTAMGAWGEMGLTPQQIWGAISYIRATFRDGK